VPDPGGQAPWWPAPVRHTAVVRVGYLAAPLFTAAEREFNRMLAAGLRANAGALEWLVPQEFCAVHDTGHAAGAPPDFAAIFADCVAHLERAEVVVAVLDGADADSGTCWEVGYAYARGVPVVGLRTDWRPGEDGGANCMLTRSCRELCRSPDELWTCVGRAGR